MHFRLRHPSRVPTSAPDLGPPNSELWREALSGHARTRAWMRNAFRLISARRERPLSPLSCRVRRGALAAHAGDVVISESVWPDLAGEAAAETRSLP